MEENRFGDAHESFTDLDLADAGKTASTAAGSAAIVAKAVLPGPTSLSPQNYNSENIKVS